jgi:hypothetical protein
LHLRRAIHCKLCEQYDPKSFQPHPHPSLKGRPTSIITERQILSAFGPLTNGLTASHFRKQIFEFRNGLR